MMDDQKTKSLRERRCLNPHPGKVTCELFEASDFFDPRDLLQVKYEMVRSVRIEKKPIRQAAQRYGFSRPSAYKALADFDAEGVTGLERTKPGPRQAHKLNESVLKFVKDLKTESPSTALPEIVDRIEEEFGVRVHLRSIQRGLSREKKKE